MFIFWSSSCDVHFCVCVFIYFFLLLPFPCNCFWYLSFGLRSHDQFKEFFFWLKSPFDGGSNSSGREEKRKNKLSASLSTPSENKTWCFYQRRLRDLVSPVCGNIFFFINDNQLCVVSPIPKVPFAEYIPHCKVNHLVTPSPLCLQWLSSPMYLNCTVIVKVERWT